MKLKTEVTSKDQVLGGHYATYCKDYDVIAYALQNKQNLRCRNFYQTLNNIAPGFLQKIWLLLSDPIDGFGLELGI